MVTSTTRDSVSDCNGSTLSTAVCSARPFSTRSADWPPLAAEEKKRPPPGRPQATDSEGGYRGISVPGVSIWGEKLFCGENGPPLKRASDRPQEVHPPNFHTTHNQHATETTTEPAQKESTFIIIKKIQRNQSERI